MQEEHLEAVESGKIWYQNDAYERNLLKFLKNSFNSLMIPIIKSCSNWFYYQNYFSAFTFLARRCQSILTISISINITISNEPELAQHQPGLSETFVSRLWTINHNGLVGAEHFYALHKDGARQIADVLQPIPPTPLWKIHCIGSVTWFSDQQ